MPGTAISVEKIALLASADGMGEPGCPALTKQIPGRFLPLCLPGRRGWVAKMTIGDSVSEAASVEEAEVFHAFARKWTPLSHEIRRVEFRFGEDSDGSPAVWIIVVVPEDLSPSKEKIDDLYRASESMRKDVLESDIHRWPYITIKTE